MTDRLRVSLEAVLKLLLPRVQESLAFYALWEMRVLSGTPPAPPGLPGVPAVFVTPGAVTCIPVDPAIVALMPPQVQIPIRPGPSGAVCIPTPGSTVLVGFANADPGKPYIAALDAQVMATTSLVNGLKVFANASTDPAAAALLTYLETLG